jgi:hypothetical protein
MDDGLSDGMSARTATPGSPTPWSPRSPLPFWAYLMGAVAFAPYQDGNLAAILVMSFTVVSGLVAPRADKPKLREQPQEVATPERLPAVAAPERLPEVAATERPRLVDVLAG